jgi:hypothetical protein
MVFVNLIVVRMVHYTVDECLSSDPVLSQECDVHIQAASASRIKLAALAYLYLSPNWLILLKFPA